MSLVELRKPSGAGNFKMVKMMETIPINHLLHERSSLIGWSARSTQFNPCSIYPNQQLKDG